MQVLTNPSEKSHSNRGPNVSRKTLAELVRCCLDGSASADERERFAFYSTTLLHASIAADRRWSLPREDLLKKYFELGDASAAARDLGISERTGRQWVADYARFVDGVQASQDRQSAADVACELICGRKRQHKPSFGPEPWHSRKMREKPGPVEPKPDDELVSDGGGCAGCPRRVG